MKQQKRKLKKQNKSGKRINASFFILKGEMNLQYEDIWKASTAGAGAFFGYFVGGWDVLVQVLLVLVVVDYISGIIAAAVTGQLKSKVGFVGIAKKVMLFLMVAVAAQIDLVLQENGVNVNDMIRNAVILFYIGNELLSLTENAGKIGLPIPDAVINAVEVLKGRNKKEVKKGEDK
jgi:toxin secretion/phage lysis holin